VLPRRATPGTRIRRATPDDLAQVAAVFLACWRDSYRDVLPARLLERYDEAGAAALWSGPITDPRDDETVLVAEIAGRGVLGVTRFGPDPDSPELGHVFSLYVSPAAQGLGLGGQLLRAATVSLVELGHSAATLWVFAANERSIGFYAHEGWLPDGGHRVEPAYDEPELRLRRALRSRPSAADPRGQRRGRPLAP
jgi:ribosomal protein S18 acetylase RimI-like enzyme